MTTTSPETTTPAYDHPSAARVTSAPREDDALREEREWPLVMANAYLRDSGVNLAISNILREVGQVQNLESRVEIMTEVVTIFENLLDPKGLAIFASPDPDAAENADPYVAKAWSHRANARRHGKAAALHFRCARLLAETGEFVLRQPAEAEREDHERMLNAELAWLHQAVDALASEVVEIN